jgi:ferredoxin
MEAISIQSGEGDENIVHVDNRECIMCSTCIEKCPQAILGYDTGVPDRQTSPQVDLPRRRLAGALAAGALAAPVAALDFGRDTQAKAVLRPPNSVPEDSFLSLCIRCGACMKVCPTNALHPLLFENGLPEAFSPVMIPRYGYCSYDCNLCGQVCPTGAIPFFNLERKHARSQGVAVVNRNRCIPYVENRDCLVCEEHCPTSPKAIVVERVTEKRADGETFEIKRPVIRPERCVGCGICENKCPVSGMGAINVHPYSPQKWRKNIESAGEALPSGQEIETTENYGDDGNYGNTESNYGYGQ